MKGLQYWQLLLSAHCLQVLGQGPSSKKHQRVILDRVSAAQNLHRRGSQLQRVTCSPLQCTVTYPLELLKESIVAT